MRMERDLSEIILILVLAFGPTMSDDDCLERLDEILPGDAVHMDGESIVGEQRLLCPAPHDDELALLHCDAEFNPLASGVNRQNGIVDQEDGIGARHVPEVQIDEVLMTEVADLGVLFTLQEPSAGALELRNLLLDGIDETIDLEPMRV